METLRFEIPNVPEVLRAVATVLTDMAGGNDRQLELSFPYDVPVRLDTFQVPIGDIVAQNDPPPPATLDGERSIPVTNPFNASVELDADGLPWDSRINAGAKTKIQSGAWKLKRGSDPALVADVHAELRAAMAASPISGVVAPSAPPPPPPPPATATPMVLADLILKITGDPDISQVRVMQELTAMQVPSLPVLGSTRPDLIPALAARLWPEEYA